jgi:thiamine-phosphate pyrophosphorylase
MIRYAITGGEGARPAEALLADARRWAEGGLEFVQLRKKWMEAGELVALAAGIMEVFRVGGGRTRLLVNGRTDVAIAAGADGVHLTSDPDELTVQQVRELFGRAGRVAGVSVSCHSVEEVERAAGAGADLILFGPVFEKRVDGVLISAGKGAGMLREACEVAGEIPVLALGGVTSGNAVVCLEAGADGVAGIRLFARGKK